MNKRHGTIGLLLLLCACSPDDANQTSSPASAGPEPIAGAPQNGEIVSMVDSWIIETEEPMAPDEVSAAAEAVIGEITAVEPLFPDDPDLGSIYVVRGSEAVDERQALDIMHRLRDLPVFIDVAPDFQVHEALVPRSAAMACKRGASENPPEKKGWSLGQMNVQGAWALVPEAPGKTQGEGVAICHPDTGWAIHVDLDSAALDLDNDYDFIDDDTDSEDPLDYKGHPGHGTATGSVLISRGGVTADNATTAPGQVTGVAPKARVVPLRTIRSVVRFLDSDVARAVNHARGPYCDVVSMSLGGAGFFGLKKAVKRAVEEDKIIVAAAGNCVGFIVAPAKYPDTIAAAASNVDRQPWKGSSKSSRVTITAPGEAVYVARRSPDVSDTDFVEPSNGTSFATTAVAAAAATWIAFHGRDKLDSAKGQHRMTDLFRWALKEAHTPPDTGWDTGKYGYGILDLEKLLAVDITEFPKDQPRSALQPSRLSELAAAIDRDLVQTGEMLRYLFGDDGDPEELAVKFGTELERLAISDPDLLDDILRQVERRAPRTALTGPMMDRFSPYMRDAARSP